MFNLFWDSLSEEEKDKYAEDIKNSIEKLFEEHKKYHIDKNIEVHRQINDIHENIYDYFTFGTLINLETGEPFTLSTGLCMIEELLKDINDEVYVKYEKDRMNEIIETFYKKLNEGEDD